MAARERGAPGKGAMTGTREGPVVPPRVCNTQLGGNDGDGTFTTRLLTTHANVEDGVTGWCSRFGQAVFAGGFVGSLVSWFQKSLA